MGICSWMKKKQPNIEFQQDYPVFTVLDHSGLSDEEIDASCSAIERQVREHVAPAWNGMGAQARVIRSQSYNENDPYSWPIAVTDDPAGENPLGYHHETQAGAPMGVVYVYPAQDKGLATSVVLSHEVLEMLGDPHICYWAKSPASGHFYAQELCDAVQGDIYQIDGVDVSDFVFPNFFNPDGWAAKRYSYLGAAKAPFATAPKGYQLVTDGSRVWQDFGYTSTAARANTLPGSRRWKRVSKFPG